MRPCSPIDGVASLCAHTEEGEGALWSLSEARIPFLGLHPQDLITSQRSRLLTPSHWGLGHHSSRLINMNLGNTSIESIAEVQVGGTSEKSEPTAGLGDGYVERCAASWLGTRGEDPAVGGEPRPPHRGSNAGAGSGKTCWTEEEKGSPPGYGNRASKAGTWGRLGDAGSLPRTGWGETS